MLDTKKTVLILGNGFDLAHGLPTKYSHFLEFCQSVEKIGGMNLGRAAQAKIAYKKEWTSNLSGDGSSLTVNVIVGIEGMRECTRNNAGSDEVIVDNSELLEIHNLLDDNVWYEYFTKLYSSKRMKGENWIDFESEIRFVIKEVDENSTSLTDSWNEVISKDIDSSGFSKLKTFDERLSFLKVGQRKGWNTERMLKPTVKDFREKAFDDLERLTRALEIYLTAFVENIEIKASEKIPEIERLDPDYVINFNYTDTYERVYGKGEVYYIHGKADVNHSVEDNNLVLGIDEYWEGDEKNERTNFTIFKKFAQRIQKHTGNASYKYLDEMRKLYKEKKGWSGHVDRTKDHSDGVSEVYVFGHSLDVTDKDILSSFIGDDATSVIVYCMDKGTEGELIANTIKLITEKRLLKKTNHVPTKLDYKIPEKGKNPLEKFEIE